MAHLEVVNGHTEVEIPAHAVEFRRTRVGCARPIRVVKMRSFGNLGISTQGLQCFTQGRLAHPHIDNPFRPRELDHLMQRSAAFPGPVVLEDLEASTPRLLAAAQDYVRRTPGEAFVVDRPDPLGAVHIDLARVFLEAVRRWYGAHIHRLAAPVQDVPASPDAPADIVANGAHEAGWLWLAIAVAVVAILVVLAVSKEAAPA